jgi:hypothetical protein
MLQMTLTMVTAPTSRNHMPMMGAHPPNSLESSSSLYLVFWREDNRKTPPSHSVNAPAAKALILNSSLNSNAHAMRFATTTKKPATKNLATILARPRSCIVDLSYILSLSILAPNHIHSHIHLNHRPTESYEVGSRFYLAIDQSDPKRASLSSVKELCR